MIAKGQSPERAFAFVGCPRGGCDIAAKECEPHGKAYDVNHQKPEIERENHEHIRREFLNSGIPELVRAEREADERRAKKAAKAARSR